MAETEYIFRLGDLTRKQLQNLKDLLEKDKQLAFELINLLEIPRLSTVPDELDVSNDPGFEEVNELMARLRILHFQSVVPQSLVEGEDKYELLNLMNAKIAFEVSRFKDYVRLCERLDINPMIPLQSVKNSIFNLLPNREEERV